MAWGVILSAILVGVGAAAVQAHKGKLPQDALTLVRQASALLAQNPGMGLGFLALVTPGAKHVGGM